MTWLIIWTEVGHHWPQIKLRESSTSQEFADDVKQDVNLICLEFIAEQMPFVKSCKHGKEKIKVFFFF